MKSVLGKLGFLAKLFSFWPSFLLWLVPTIVVLDQLDWLKCNRKAITIEVTLAKSNQLLQLLFSNFLDFFYESSFSLTRRERKKSREKGSCRASWKQLQDVRVEKLQKLKAEAWKRCIFCIVLVNPKCAWEVVVSLQYCI